MPDNNAYRKNIQDNNAPKQVSSWSYGGSSDSGVIPAREIYKKIYEVGQTDADRGAKLAVDFYKIQNTQSSPYYNPYSQATNQAVGKLSAMGINTSGMNTDWFKANTDWQKDLVYSGTSNSPVTPPKKTATAQQNAAYQMWQLSKQAELTDKVDSEWAAMQQEIYYWTQRSDLNLSDDDIIAKVNENKQKNYPTLYALDKSRQPGQTLLELNHGTDYSEDNMYGVIWSARNGKSTGNVFNDNLMSAGGRGNTWQANDDISAKMDRGNLETYSPFSVGMTADDVGLYWGVTGIDDDMLKKIESQVDWNNQTDVDMFNKASEALATTKKAEEEKALLEESIKTWVKRGYSEETIQTKLEKLMAKSDFATLRKMDEDIQKREARNKMVQTAYAVDYRRQDVDAMIRDLIAERDNKPSAAKTMRDIVGGIGGLVTNPAGTIEQGVSDFFGAVKSIGDAITGAGQQPTGQQTVPTAPEAKPTEDAILTNAPAETQVAPPTQPTAPSYPVITDADIEQAAEKDRKIAGAVATIENNTTDDEKIVLQNAGSSMWNTARDFFSGAKADPAMSQAIATQSADTAKHGFFDTALANVDTIANYENTQTNLANWEKQFAQYEAKWGDLSDYQKEFHTEFSKTVENNVEVFLTYDDEKKRYVVSNIVSPERGIVSMYDDIIPHSYDANSEAYRLMNVAEQVALQATEDANKVLTAQERVKAGGDSAAQEIAGYKALYAQIERAKEYLKKNEGNYNKSKSAFEDSYTSLGSVAAALGWLGDGNDNGINEMLTMTEFFSQYSKQPQLPASSETALQRVDRLYLGEATDDQKAAYIKQEIAKIDQEIEKLTFGLEWAEKNGYQLPDSYKKNIQYKLEDLAVQKREAEYCQILTDTDPKELEAAIKAGKAFEEKHGLYGENEMESWDLFYGQEKKIAEYYHTLRERTLYRDDKGTEWVDDDGVTHTIPTITEDDENVYYYLLGKKVLELGDEFENLWADGTNLARAGEVLDEIMKDSNDYIDFMSNDDYGIWTSRNIDRTEQKAENMVDSGVLGGIAANLVSTLSTPLESVESALYLLDRAVGDKRINPDSSSRRISAFKESTRQATFKSIKDVYGEGSIQEKLASLGYEIYSNRGDSLMNSMVFGPIFGFSGKFADMLNEFAGASPMGATAALNAAAHAVEQGASTDQAWLIAGITFLSETVTEAITYSNIRDAFGTTKELTGESLKSFLKEWLTESGVEEAFGESLNDILENAAQVWAENNYSNGDYQSELTALMDKYIGEGMTEDEARIAAIQEQAQGVLHTALVSYLSAGTDVGIQAGKAALNTTNNYRTATRALQKIGIGNSMLDNMLNDWRRSRNGEQITAEEAVAEGEAPVVKAEEATEKEAPTEEQRETATDVVNIERSKGSDASTQSAAVASALNTSTKKNKTDHKADAAAAYLTRVFGENGSTIVQETLAGAAEAKVDVKAVKQAIKNAALGDGAATALVQSEAFKKATPANKARMLVQTLQQDSFDQKVQSTINSRVQDFRKTRTISDLAANGHFDQAQADRAAAEKAAQNTQRVEQELDTQRGVQQAAADAVQQAKDMLLENAKDPQGVNAVTQAANKADKQATVVHEYEQSAAKARQDQQAAEEKADQSAADAMATAREAGDQQIAQEDHAEVEAEAQEQAAQQAAEEEQARLQAEEDERTGKAQEDRENAAIDQAVETENLEGVEAENRKDDLKETRDKVKIKLRDLSKPVSDAEAMLALGALERKLGIKINLEDMGKVTKQGWTRGKYSDGVITLNKNMTLGQALVEAALHEITHSMRNTNSYKAYRDVVMKSVFGETGEINALYENNAGFRAKVDATIAERIDAGDRNFVGKSHDEQVAAAEDEIVADFARLNLAEKDVVERFMDAGMGGKMRNLLHNINQLLKNYFSNMTGEERQQAEYFRKAERAFQKAINEVAKNSEHPEGSQFSIMQIAQATGMTFNEDTLQLFDQDGNEIDGVNRKITPDMIVNTPVGMLIDNGLTGEQNTKAKEMMAGLMNLVAKYKDSNLVWEIGATTLSSTFSALKSNSDPQYKTTVDFGTVCAKTQAIIDTLSQVMLDKVKEGDYGGLTRKDIMKVYDAVNKTGLSVPCPVCYVFSRWMGVPSLLGQMSQYQHNYVVTNEDGSINKEATQKKVDDYIAYAEKEYGDAKAINSQKTKLQNRQTSLEEKRIVLEKELRALPKGDKKARNAKQKEIDSVLDELTDVDAELGKVNAYNWITQALCKKDKNGKYVVDDKFQLTPDEILFDLNRTGDFAAYEKNWRYRNTRGAGMGKAIMPYSGETIGDILYGVKKGGRQSTIRNPWLNMDDKSAARQLNDARKRAAKQNLVGGQRLQSTSDFRPEWGLDYIMSFLELQAAGSKVQMYTKVAEAVDFFASVGADVNLSIMGKGQGWHVDENGNYVLDFSNVTGMDYDTAKALKDKYDNVQMILVGMNDTHIRLALANSDIDFVIPWHSSGNSKDVISGLMSTFKETLENGHNYEDSQSDTFAENRTEEQVALWDARMKLLTKGGNALTEAERMTLLSNPITADLYKRFTQKGVDDECYGVKLSKEQAKQIFPYEYWDTSLTKDQADKNGQRFLDYCDAMGIVPRFSQFKDDAGYWKLLIDRPMYNNDGTYHQQQIIDVTNARIGDLNESGQLEGSDLPTQAQAKYAPKDPRNPNYEKYTEAQKQAIENAEAAIREQYDDGSEGQQSVYGEMSDADLAMLSTAGEQTAADEAMQNGTEQEDIETLVRNGALTKEEADDYLGMVFRRIGNYGEQVATGRQLEGTNPNASTAQGPAVRAFGAEDGMLNSSDEIANFAKEVTLAQNTYFPDTNSEQIARAVNWIRTLKKTPNSDGYAEALEAVTADNFDYRSADGQARMVAVMGLAAAKNDVMAQAALADAFMRQGTDLGRALQARKLFKLMTPEGRIETLQRMLNNQKKALGKQGENLDLKFSKWVLEAAAVAENDADFFRVQQAAAAELAEQLPATWKDRIQTIRMLSMLGNPRTHIRNIIGNMMFEPAVALKNEMGALMELGKKPGERTKTLRFFLPKDIRDFAREVAVENRNTLTGEAKFNEAAQIKQAQAPLGQFVKLLSDLNSNALEGEDWFFLKGHFRRAFGGWMAANGYTVDQVKNDQALMEKGMQYAVEEAQKATYRDYNELASKLNDLMRNPKTKWGKALAFGVDAALPFRKTPANILRRGLEYSPLGIAKGLYTLGSQFKNGEINANQVIDEICSGLSGSMIAAAGFLLAGSGAVSCGLDDDEDKLKKAEGEQKYALNLNKLAQSIGLPKLFGKDVSFTIDWAAPMSMPFFVGAAIREQYENQGDFDFDQALNAVLSISEPLFNLSMLDGVNSLFKTSQYEDTNSITQIGMKLGMNYVSSFVPSLLGAISRTIDDTQRKTFVSSDQSKGPKGTIMYSLEQMQNKTPFGQQNIPVRNIWGEAKTSDFAERFLENFILPGYINTIEDDPIINEMGRLFDATGDAGMIPQEDPDKSVSYTNKMTGEQVKHVLTDKEWDRVKEVRGQTAFKELTQLINSKEYKNATDGEQVKMIKAIWNHADKVGKQAVLPDFPLDDTQTVETIAQDSRISSLKEQMFKSLEAESYDDYDTMVEAIRREYDDQDEADSKIRTWLRDKYSKQYKEAYRKGGAEGRVRMMEIEDFLDYTGFDFDYDKWQEAVDEKYGK